MNRCALAWAGLSSLAIAACGSNAGSGGAGGASSATTGSSASTSASASASTSKASASASSVASSTGTGTGGAAGHAFITLASGSQPYGLAVDATHVFWTNSGTGEVMQADKSDGMGQVVLTTGEDTPIAVRVAAGEVYWVSYSTTGQLRHAPIGGGAITAVCDAPAAVDLALGTTYAFWTREPDDVQRAPLAGLPVGQMPDLLTGNPLSLGIATDDTFVYWVNRQDGTVKLANQDLSGDTTIAMGDVPWDIAIDATHVFWTEYGSLSDSGKVRQASKVDGSGAIDLATGLAEPKGIAVDATHVYWIDSFSGKIEKVPIGGGAVTTLVTGEMDPVEIAVDDTDVYWTARGSDTIGKVAK